jgi:hypothetical protein
MQRRIPARLVAVLEALAIVRRDRLPAGKGTAIDRPVALAPFVGGRQRVETIIACRDGDCRRGAPGEQGALRSRQFGGRRVLHQLIDSGCSL